MKHVNVHGSYPFSDWDDIWVSLLKNIPVAAALVFVADAIATLQAAEPPYKEEPPEVEDFLLNKTFRIIRRYPNSHNDVDGDLVLAVYNHDGRFSLIEATVWNYELVAKKKYRSLVEDPPIPFVWS